MYTYIALSICGVTLVYVLLRYRVIYHPLVIFNLMWFVVFSLESIHLYGLFTSEDRIYLYMLGGIVAFNMGFFLWNSFRQTHRIRFKYKRCYLTSCGDKSYEPRYLFIYVLGIFCVIYNLHFVITSLGYLLSGRSLGEIRKLVQDGTSNYYIFINKSKILNAVSVIFLTPGETIVQLVGMMDYWFGKKDKKLIILAITLTVMSSIGKGGRASIVNLLIFIVMGYFFSGVCLKKREIKSKLVKKKRKKVITIAVLVVSLFLVWFSISRTGQSLYKNLYLYFSMQPYMFNIWAKVVDETGVYGYGEAALNGFSFSVLYIIKNIFNIDFPTHWKLVYDLIRATDSEWQIITNIYTRANAYVSAFWFLYLDGRFIGILVGMFIYGIYLAHSFCEAVKTPNIKTVAIYTFVFQGLVYVFIRFPFSNIYYAISYIMLVLFAFKIKKR